MNSVTTSGALRAVISGSYRKHLPDLMRLKTLLEKRGIIVLSPVGTSSINPGEEFILLDADPISDHRLLQDSVFAKIRTSSFLVVANIDGYLGNAALMEMGYAIALGLQILALNPIQDPNLIPYCRLITDLFPEVSDMESDKLINKQCG